jgi:hypothetical protein
MMAGLVLCTVCWCCHGCEHAQLSDQVSASVLAVNLCAWGVCVRCVEQQTVAPCTLQGCCCGVLCCVGCWGGSDCTAGAYQHVHLSWVLATSIPVVCTAVVPPAVSVAEVPVCVSQVPENGMTDLALLVLALLVLAPQKQNNLHNEKVA